MNIDIIENNRYMVSFPMQSVKTKETKTRFKSSFDLNRFITFKHIRNCPAIIQNNYCLLYFISDMAQIKKSNTFYRIITARAPKDQKKYLGKWKKNTQIIKINYKYSASLKRCFFQLLCPLE